ncbi:methyltransferase domain-containing protein [Prochlorococcus sp. MIT 1341]|uniref:methyltransferase domain-containing protein n=1 Tax=Prochlorococcus sp. MIT 1341 TaxID=3096221 RepID=UPI002A7516E0|nr:methyltransferase domain-containing protein [Prochlorococcus sp. MIT 1341]
MACKVLTDYQREKIDKSDDCIFYATPRFVYHLDKSFRERLTQLYREHLTRNSVVLDLMSSWVSHLPNEFKFHKVIGHGLNKIELESNKRLDSFWTQDLNQNQKLPLDDSSVDYCLMVAGWQYLQQPEEIALELKRVLRPKGKIIVSFSNRAFWDKAPRIWTHGSDSDHINYVSSILISQGWTQPDVIAESTVVNGFFRIFGSKGDPFFSVIATN